MSDPIDCVAFLLVRDGEMLAERRGQHKRLAPGVLAIPGGHLEPGESIDDGVRRELFEELGLVPLAIEPICTLIHEAEEVRRLHYVAISSWTGEMVVNEAETVEWLPISDPSRLDLLVDRQAVACWRDGGSGS